MSRVPWSTFARCRVCLAMVDIRPPIGSDGRHSTVDLSRPTSSTTCRTMISAGVTYRSGLWQDSSPERIYGTRSVISPLSVVPNLYLVIVKSSAELLFGRYGPAKTLTVAYGIGDQYPCAILSLSVSPTPASSNASQNGGIYGRDNLRRLFRFCHFPFDDEHSGPMRLTKKNTY